MPAHAETPPTAEAHFCEMCGYDLRGLAEARCPECGVAFDPTAQVVAEVPWLRRREIGRLRGYHRTVWLVVARPRAFARQAARPVQVDVAAGDAFRRVSVVVAAVSAALVAAAMEIVNTTARPLDEATRRAATTAVAALPALLAFFWIATARVPVTFHDGRSRQAEARFASLQRFCCAGLGLWPLAALCGIAVAAMARAEYNEAPVIAAMIALIIAVFAAWCGGCAMFLLLAGRVRASNALAAFVASVGLWCIALFGALVTGFATLAVGQLFVD